MSKPARPTGPAVPQIPGVPHEERRHLEGRAFGFRWDLDIRITTLFDADETVPGPLLLPDTRRLALPPSGEPPDVAPAPIPEWITRWESDGGR